MGNVMYFTGSVRSPMRRVTRAMRGAGSLSQVAFLLLIIADVGRATESGDPTYEVAWWQRPAREKLVGLGMEPALQSAATCECGWPPSDPNDKTLCAPFPALCGMCQNVVSSMYWDGVDGSAGCGSFQEYSSDVCIAIAGDVSGMADPVRTRMREYYDLNGPYFGASRAVCTELGCCEPNADCKEEGTGEFAEDWSTCTGDPPKGMKTEKKKVISPQLGKGKPCPPNEGEKFDCCVGACCLDFTKCAVTCDLSDLFATYCPGVHVHRKSDNYDYFKSCPADQQKAKAKDQKLKDLAELLKKAGPAIPGLKVEIAGHASCTGPYALNKALSNARAAWIHDVLVNDLKVPKQYVSKYGYAIDCPKEPNDEGTLKKNQRVEVYLISSKCKGPAHVSPGGDGSSGSGTPPRCEKANDYNSRAPCKKQKVAVVCKDPTYC